MHKKLILKAFEKAKNEEEKLTGIIVSKNRLSEIISEVLLNDYKCVFGDKSLRVLYTKAKNNDDEDFEIKQVRVVDSLCKYLGYEDYIDFVNNNSNLKGDAELSKNKNGIHKTVNFITKNKFFIILGFLLIIVLVIFSKKQQRWMVWENNQYIEVEFDAEKYSLDQLKIYKEETVVTFKKIKPSCDLIFFDKSGNPKFWYGKNLKGELELFSSVGLHPETGKTLKPISKYMIDKYICFDISNN